MHIACFDEQPVPERTTHLFLVDDDSSFRASMRASVSGEGVILHEFESPQRFLEFLVESDYSMKKAWQMRSESMRGCVLTDLHMPGMSGLQLMKTLYQRKIRLPLIMISGDPNLSAAVECMRLGAASFVVKPFDPKALLQLVVDTAHEPVDMLRNPVACKEKLRLLTPRERQVMNFVCEGRLNKTIADMLGISVKTVELHRAKVISKLKVRNIQDLVRLNLGY